MQACSRRLAEHGANAARPSGAVGLALHGFSFDGAVNKIELSTYALRASARVVVEGRELIGPSPGAASKSDERFCSDHFDVRVEQRNLECFDAIKPC